jgi:hypothetical protein
MMRSRETGSEVTVLFTEAALIFALPRGATLEELATRIAAMEARHFGEPVAIGVTLRH